MLLSFSLKIIFFTASFLLGLKCVVGIGSDVEIQRSFKDSKCDGELYQLGHGYIEFFQECNQEIIEKNLVYEEYNWIFYSCIIKKSLAGSDLTLLSFAKLMSQNLSVTHQDLIMQNLVSKEEHPDSPAPAEDESTTDYTASTDIIEITEVPGFHEDMYKETYVERLKLYWKQYFDAEFRVCGKKFLATCEKGKRNKCDFEDCVQKARNYSEPFLFCSTFRTIILRPNLYTRKQHEECVNKWITGLTLFTYSHAKGFAESICLIEGTSVLHPDSFYTTGINFRSLYRKLIGGFLPASIRKFLFLEFRKALRLEGIVLDKESPFKHFPSKVQHKFKLVKWAKHVKEEKNNEKQAILNYFSINTMIKGVNRAQKSLCKMIT
ncbi:unnamed protein product [Allacma fusca]|uniref:Uncharacterized protein n=1 Tax=Allacma fusca TaxID=39272 RepID=A0A8J2K3K9_9HEXA|nr:unnamed protein product [Allacma fusca]